MTIQIDNGKIQQCLLHLSLCWHQKHKTVSRLVHQEGTTLFLKSPLWISFVFMHFVCLWVWNSYALFVLQQMSAYLLQFLLAAFSSDIVFIRKPDECSFHHHPHFRFPKSSNGNTHTFVYKSEAFWKYVKNETAAKRSRGGPKAKTK